MMKKVISRRKKQMVSYKYQIGTHKKIVVCDAEVMLTNEGKVDYITFCLTHELEIDWIIELLKRIRKDFEGKWAEGLIEFKKILEMTDKERAEFKKAIEREERKMRTQ